MPTIAELRRMRPRLANLTDDEVVQVVASDYPDVPVDKIAADLGVKVTPPPVPGRSALDVLKDTGISAAKGVIGTGEAVVGLGDMVSGGGLGNMLEQTTGYRPKVAQQMLADQYSDPQKAAFAAVDQADGFTGKLGAALTHPSTIAHSVVESLPSMLGGGAAAQGLMKFGPLAKAIGAGTAGALGEGVTMAGNAAEQTRQETGTLDGRQTMLALADGAQGAGFSMLGAKIAKKLGIHDIDTMIAAGKVNDVAAKGLTRRVLEGAVSEGVLEELPQSVVEQVLQNMATGKPIDDGVDQAAVMGLLAGAAMGGGANVMGGHGQKKADATAAPAVAVDPTVGPLSAAAAAAQVTTGATAPGAADPKRLGEAVAALSDPTDDQKKEQDPKAVLEKQLAAEAPKPEPDPFDFSKPLPGEPALSDRDAQIYADATGGAATNVEKPVVVPGTVDEGAHESHSSPLNDRTATDKNILANNAKLGHVDVNGLGISVENTDGSERVDKANTPPKWRTAMQGVHYGYIKGTTAADSTPGKKQGVDVFLKSGTPKDYDYPVYVVDQINQHDGSFDEHKVMLGFRNRAAAVMAYKRHYAPGWKLGRVTEMQFDAFKDWVKDPALTSKPASPKGPLTEQPLPPSELRNAIPPGKWNPAKDSNATAADQEGAAAPAAAGSPTTEQPVAAPAAGSAPVQADGLTVTYGGRTFGVESVEDAQAKWNAYRDEMVGRGSGGASEIGNGVDVMQGGKPAGRVSYNGRFHPAGATDAKPQTQIDAGGTPALTHDGADAASRGNESGSVAPADAAAGAASTQEGGTPAAAGPVDSGQPGVKGEQVEHHELPYPQKGWKGVPLAEVGVRKMADGTYGVTHGYNTAMGGYGSPLDHSARHATAEEARKAGATQVKLAATDALKRQGNSSTETERLQNVVAWADKLAGATSTGDHAWDRMTMPERLALLAGTKAKNPQGTAAKGWAQLSDGWHSTIDKLMAKAPAAPAPAPAAPAPAPAPAAPAEKFHASIAAAEDDLKAKGRDTHQIVRDRRGLVVRPKQATPAAPTPTEPKPTAAPPAANDEPSVDDQSTLDEPEGREGWQYVTSISGDDGVSYQVDARSIVTSASDLMKAVRQIRVYDANSASHMAVWEWRSAKMTDAALDGLQIDSATFHYVMSNATESAFGDAAADGDALWAKYGQQITRELKQPAADGPAQAPAPAALPAPAPKPSGNTIFTDEAADKARAFLKKRLGTLNSGIDPELMQAGITLAGWHIEKGARSFAAFAKNMLADLGDEIRPYLKSWYMAVRYDPRAGEFVKEMSSPSMVDEFNVADVDTPKTAKQAIDDKAGGVTFGDHKAVETAREEGHTLTRFLAEKVDKGEMPKDNPALKKLVELYDGKPATAERMKQAQEHLEAAIVQRARVITSINRGEDRKAFDALLALYESQPNLNVRTSTSIENQAYSTPAPLAYLASRLTGIEKGQSVLEPTAGTGMLLIGATISKADVNELNPERRELLQEQGFRVSGKDAATEPLRHAGYPVDAVITNPPFGSLKDDKGNTRKERVDGYQIGQIDHLIAARALATMKDDGRATLIIGANKVAGGMNTDDRIFFNWLYSHYNVTSHFEVDGKLYTRQGAAWPVRVITIAGRQESDALAPQEGTIQRVYDWEQVYGQFEQALVASGKQPDARAAASPGSASDKQAGTRGVSGSAGKPAADAGEHGPRGSAARPANVPGERTEPVVDRGGKPAKRVGDADRNERPGAEPAATDRLDAAGKPAATGADEPAQRAGDVAPLADADNAFQTKYVPRSATKDEGVLIPVNMAQPLQEALSKLEDEVGDLDEFAAKELGYDTVADLHKALMGLQVDSVAAAIHQIKNGKALIIADQTGIGKGRQAAAIIRWAVRAGKTPVFFTVKPQLFTDMHVEDLRGIGADKMVKPFVMNVNEPILDHDGTVLHVTSQGDRKRAMEGMKAGEMPKGSNALFVTYSQINVENDQRAAIAGIAPNSVFILDESHNAGGESATGQFVRDMLDLAQGTVYLSATYAKRPDNMPLYYKTDMGEAVADNDTLLDAMSNGGLPLQTVVSNNLVKAGQMFRRERSFDGISIVSRVNTKDKAAHEKLSDATTEALRSIVSADKAFHTIYFGQIAADAKAEGKAAKEAGNQASRQVDHTEFSSVVHNFVRQLLLGLNVDEAANSAIDAIKAGKKPVIAVENTMGSFLNEYAARNGITAGDPLGDYGYRTVLTRALERTRYYTEKDRKGDEKKIYVPLEKLDAVTRARYDAAQAVIDNLDVDVPASPIDWMRARLQKAGYSVAEITGRALAVDYTDPKVPRLAEVPKEERDDKVLTTRRFNGLAGAPLDAIILNVSGSTGISLHASEKFKDRRPRKMVVAQAAQDINILMQMLGRVHRTGQVVLPEYEFINPDLPAVIRPMALTSKKMKSLNANTSSNTESATSVEATDMLNKYGDQVVGDYLRDNRQLAHDMGLQEVLAGDENPQDLARKATGRLALMPVAVQKQFYEEVESQYKTLIEFLNKTNQNELEPRTFDFDAKELKTETIFEGTNPDSPFGENATYGEYSIKAQGKPMTPAEIQSEMAENLAGVADGRAHAEAINQKLTGPFGAYVKSLADQPELQQLAHNTGFLGRDFIESHAIGSKFRVDINGDQYNAIVTNLRSSWKEGKPGNPFSLSKVSVTIAVNGGLRHLTVPATQFQKIETSRLPSHYNVEHLFRVVEQGREVAKIITGNLLGAYGELRGVRGTIISFTKEDKSSELGILLPKTFTMADNAKGGYRLRSGAEAVKFLHDSNAKGIEQLGISTRDGVVRVTPSRDGDRGITIRVPKSKAKGGKYFLDKAIRAVTGDFVTQGDRMVAQVPADKAAAAIDALMKKGAIYALESHAAVAKGMFGDKPMFSQRQDTPDGMTITQGGRVKRSADNQALLDTVTPPSERDTSFRATVDGKVVGYLDLAVGEDGKTAEVREVKVGKAFQRRGIATALYDQARRAGFDVQRSQYQTDEGSSFRDAYDRRAAFRQGGAESVLPADARKIGQLQQTVDAIREGWARAPDVTVVGSVASAAVPLEVRQEARNVIENGGSIPSGVWFDGKVWLFADRIRSEQDAIEVLLHESLGHMGLRGMFGEGLEPILRQVAATRRAEVASIIRRNGFQESERLRAAEELLAEMAQTRPELGFVQRAIAAIKTFLRKAGLLRADRMSDGEIIRSFILPARQWVEKGGAGKAATVAAFSQRPGFTFDAKDSPLYKHRTASQVHVPAAAVVDAALAKDATARRILDKGAAPADGELVGVRLNVNVLKSTGVAVHSIHRGKKGEGYKENRGLWGGEVINYEPVVELKDAYFNVGQKARERIAAGEGPKEPMASVDGRYQARKAHSFDGVEFRFNPKREHLFRDGLGRVLRHADEVTLAGNSAFARGNIEYYGEEDVPARAGDAPTQGKLFEPGNDEGVAMFSQADRTVQIGNERRPVDKADGTPIIPDHNLAKLRAFWRSWDGEEDSRGRPIVTDEEVKRLTQHAGPMFSQGSLGVNQPRDFWKQAMGTFDEYRNTPGKLNWWQKTFGTPYDLAQRSPPFKRVYDKVQEFLRDVSLYATEAADLAPRILPKLDSWKDAFKKPLSAEDTKAIQAPVFEGTLKYGRDRTTGKPILASDLEARFAPLDVHQRASMLLGSGAITDKDLARVRNLPIETYEAFVNNRFEQEFTSPGVVWKDEELKSMFHLTDDQIGLYKEARAAIDKSLTSLILADMVRYAGKDARPIAQAVMDTGSLEQGADMLRQYLLSLAPTGDPRSGLLTDMAGKINDKALRGQKLIDRGYAPLSRFGKYTVDAVDKDGTRVYFGMFESRMEARKMAAQMRDQFPEATIRRGTTSQQSHEMFRGLTPETAELFGEMLGLEADGEAYGDVAFQKFLKEAKANRSAMKRLIERKGTAGFSEDVGRVLASFIYSNARQTSHSLHTKEIGEQVMAIDAKEHGGELKDAAIRLQKYVMEPQEEAVGLRQMLFAQYLGGSVAAMMVNMTQPFAVTAPYLTQWAGIGRVAALMKGATADVWKESTGDAGLDAALKLSAERGVVAPQEVHQLMRQGQGKASLVAGDGTLTGNASAMVKNQFSRLAFLWGQPFAVAELFNRRLTFIAAYRLAVETGQADPVAFAEKAISDTQFTYNKGNKPEWARGAVGGLLFTFKQYSISYLELVHRMYTQGGPEGKRAALLMLGMLMLMGGAGGMPFAEDVTDLIDGIGQRLGFNLRTKHARQKFLEDTFGKTLGGMIDHGVTGIPGMPVDVASRFGMGNLIPGTGLLTKKKDHTSDVTEILGPAGDMASRAFQGANLAADGRPVAGMLAAAPKMFGNWQKAWDMANLGYYTDQNGKKVVDTSGGDVLSKVLGFQPHDVAQVQGATRDVQQMVAFAQMKEVEIADKWAQGVFKHDPEATQSAKDELAAWNRDNPDSPIKIKQQQIRKRVSDMRKSKEERIASTAPREVRAAVKRELRDSHQ